MKCGYTAVRRGVWMTAAAGLAGWLGTVASAQMVWTGMAGNNQWFTPGNWSMGAVPGTMDDAVVPPGFPAITVSGADVRSLRAQSPLTLSGIVALRVAQGSTIRDASIVGGINAAGLLTFDGDVTVQDGYSWGGTGGFRNTGTMTVLAVPVNGQFANEGTLTVPGTFTVAGAASMLNNTGTLELGAAGNLYSGGLVVNNATLRKTGSGVSLIQCRVQQDDGSVEVQAGTLILSGGAQWSGGTVSVAGGATLRMDQPSSIPYTFAGIPSFGGGGDAVIAVAGQQSPAVVVTLDQTIDLHGPLGLSLQSGNLGIQSGASLRNTGKLTWETFAVQGPGVLVNDAAGSLSVAASASASGNVLVRNAGSFDMAASLSLNGAAVENMPGGHLTLEGGEFPTPNPATGTVVNRGTLSKVVSALARIQPRFEQRDMGSTTVAAGELQLQGGGELGAGGGRFVVGVPLTSSGATLSFTGGTFAVTGAGHVITSAGEQPLARATYPAVINVQQGATLTLAVADNAAVGEFLLDSGAQLGGAGAISNQRVFVWRGQIGVGGVASVENTGVVSIPYGSGPLLRGTFTNRMLGDVYQGGNLDLANGTAVNEGYWAIGADPADVQISGGGGVLRNTGWLDVGEFSMGRAVNVTTMLDNPGRVSVTKTLLNLQSAQVAQVQNGSLIGGTWETYSGGRIRFAAGVHRVAGAVVWSNGLDMPFLNSLNEIDSGELHATDDITAPVPVEVKGGGTLDVQPGATVTVPGHTDVGTPQSVNAYCDHHVVVSFQPDPPLLITPVLNVWGTIRPGGHEAPGPFNLQGNLVMMGTGTAEVELGGLVPENEFDRANITGSASLDGTLAVSLLTGFVPQAGQTFTILSATQGVSGVFASIAQPAGMPQGLSLEAQYAAGGVTLRVVSTCYANCDGSTGAPVLNVNDFICFQTRFAAGSAYANCDGSTQPPVLNVNDFICFQQRFAGGCR